MYSVKILSQVERSIIQISFKYILFNLLNFQWYYPSTREHALVLWWRSKRNLLMRKLYLILFVWFNIRSFLCLPCWLGLHKQQQMDVKTWTKWIFSSWDTFCYFFSPLLGKVFSYVLPEFQPFLLGYASTEQLLLTPFLLFLFKDPLF